MKKLRLDLDDLKVESFQTTPEAKDREGQGTVMGYITQDLTLCDECRTDLTCAGTCGGVTCVATCIATCNPTCGSTCEQSCAGSCGCVGPTCSPDCNTNFLCFICTDFRC